MEIRKNYFDFYTPDEWNDIIEDCKKSGLKVSAYCKKNKIPLGSFYKWKDKLNPSLAVSLKGITDKWKGFIEEWGKSGLSKRDYCRKKELSIDMFSRWEKRFIPLPLKKPTFNKWAEIIEDWQKSGLKKSCYCRQKKLTKSSFYTWEKKINSSHPPQSPSNLLDKQQSGLENSLKDPFITIVFDELSSKEPSITNAKIEVVFAHGDHISLKDPFDWENLSEWLSPLLTGKNDG